MELRPITDAEAHSWPRTCPICGAAVGAADWITHQCGHMVETLRGLTQASRDAVHATNGLSDALEWLRAAQAEPGGQG